MKLTITIKVFLILTFFIFLNNGLYSQNHKAEILFNDGSSIEGYGGITKNGKIKFKVSLEDEIEEWDSTIVTGIIFYNLNFSVEFEYVLIKKGKKPRLLRVMKDGKVRLYERKISYLEENFAVGVPVGSNIRVGVNLLNNRKLYLKRKEEVIATKTNYTLNIKKTLISYFKDCDVIQDMVETKEFRKYSIDEIVDTYNVFCDE